MRARVIGVAATFGALAVGVFFLFQSEAAPAEPLPAAGADAHHAATALNTFGFDLLGRLKTRSGNLCLSPYSIHTNLAMAQAGAGHQTAEQLAAVLHLDAQANAGARALHGRLQAAGNHGFELDVANRLWVEGHTTVAPAFNARLADDFHGDCTTADFSNASAFDAINQWTRQHTNGRIPQVIGPADAPGPTALVLTNALYFKGNWDKPFKKADTAAGDFLTGGRKVPAMFMTQRKEHAYGYFVTDAAPAYRALSLDYAGGDLAMLLLLPDIGQIDTLTGLLSDAFVRQVVENLHETWVPVTLPRFAMTDAFSLGSTLQEMGAKDAFNPDAADFSNLSTRRIFMQAVMHRTFIDVNEEGTEAAAATGSALAASAIPEVPPEFKADHPFMFLIRDKGTGAILFLGRVETP